MALSVCDECYEFEMPLAYNSTTNEYEYSIGFPLSLTPDVTYSVQIKDSKGNYYHTDMTATSGGDFSLIQAVLENDLGLFINKYSGPLEIRLGGGGNFTGAYDSFVIVGYGAYSCVIINFVPLTTTY